MNRPLGKTITITVLLITVVAFSLITGVTAKIVYDQSKRQSLMIASGKTQIVAAQMDGFIHSYEVVAENNVFTLAPFPKEDDAFYRGLMQNLTQSREIDFRDVYVGFKDRRLPITGIDTPFPDDYDARTRPWFIEAVKDPNKAYIFEPYFDPVLSEMTFTISRAMVDGTGDIWGVYAMDITTQQLNDYVDEANDTEDGSYYFVMNGNGDLFSHPNQALAPQPDGTIINMRAYDNGSSEELYTFIVGSDPAEAITFRNADGTASYYYTASRAELSGWYVVGAVPSGSILAPVYQTLLVLFAMFIVTAATVILVLRRSIGRRIVTPIIGIKDATASIAAGNLDFRIVAEMPGELGELSAAINTMAGELKSYIDNLTAVTAEKERIGAELSVATKIQASMLPCIFPAFPERPEFDIFASMQPAKEVGGDFYDFFLVDENTLAVVIADVSGKGVPAALFMVIAKTLIQNTALSGKRPEVVFGIVNRMLCANNDAGMFVTALLGYLDIPSGRFAFVNAGHNPPLIRKNGTFEWLKAKAGFVLAGDEDTFYSQNEITIEPGDELFLYTDGVTEAVNKENELFGETRLIETANRRETGILGKRSSLQKFAESVKYEIDLFTGGAEQADDITMLALRYKGKDESI